MEDIAAHYDQVSQAWSIIMGERQHFGFYPDSTPSLDLNIASQKLVEELFEKNPQSHEKVLEVGCGAGGTAFFLHEHFHCEVTGIALGKKEIESANESSKQKYFFPKVQFFQRDGQDNGFENESFHHVIMLESSLLIPDKQKLFQENFRVLKAGGCFSLCDQIRLRNLSAAEMYKQGKNFERLQACFGRTKTETLESYEQLLKDAGFVDIHCRDISKQTLPSPLAWKKSALDNKNKVLEYFSEEQFQIFVDACGILHQVMEAGILGYGILTARKPDYGEKARLRKPA